MYFPRMLDKIRLYAKNELRPDFHTNKMRALLLLYVYTFSNNLLAEITYALLPCNMRRKAPCH